MNAKAKMIKNKSPEYEREPVPESQTKGAKSFWGLFASEHVAGTELLIGPLFLVHGVAAFDLLVGLIIGNLLAVLSWRYLTVPIAIKHRLTLYMQIEKIGGRQLVVIYNLVNGMLWCFLAAAMIYVSASAISVLFHVTPPELDAVVPDDIRMIIIVLAVGLVISVIAARGYDAIARFANYAAPLMVVLFIALGFSTLPALDIHSLSDFWDRAQTVIWQGHNQPGFVRFTIWHIIFYSWFGNMAWHIGMGDLTIFRYAGKANYGFASAAGMFLGHYIAWICAGMLYAVQLQADPNNTAVSPGTLAANAMGIAGILLVLISGWTTANPIIYRAGLAFQGIKRNGSRVKITLIAGAIASVIGIFPSLSMNFLNISALYGLLLMPVGAVIFADHYFMKRLKMQSFFAEKKNIKFYLPPALAWVLTLGICLWLNLYSGVQVFFLGLPGWFIAVAIYMILSVYYQRKTIKK
jgi:purine-cytosine permease-like protein